MTKEVPLTPHHIIEMIKRTTIGKVATYLYYGYEMKTRVDALHAMFKDDPDALIRIVQKTDEDYVCCGEPGDQQCQGPINNSEATCFSKEKELIEAQIAKALGIQIGLSYPYRNLINLYKEINLYK